MSFSWESLLEPFDDASVSEVQVNANLTKMLLRENTWYFHPGINNNAALSTWLQDQAYERGLRLDPRHPEAGGLLHHRSCDYRWHAVIAPVADPGPILSIRRHRFNLISSASFAATTQQQTTLRQAMQSRSTIMIGGPTGSGKTSLLQALLNEHCNEERVVIVESYPEIPCHGLGWSRLCERAQDLDLVGSFSLDQAINTALRLRPDRLVVGEVRGKEAEPLINAQQAGHRGTLTTIHAAAPSEAMARLALLTKRSQSSLNHIFNKTVFIAMKRGTPPKIGGISYVSS